MEDYYKEFKRLQSNKELLKNATEEFLDKLIDHVIIGVAFQVHRSKKLKVIELDEVVVKQEGPRPCVDIFGPYNFKKKYECLCRNCDRVVGASVFAPHLEVCMGMGRSRSRNASRRIANNSRERENSTYSSGVPSDDEDDMDWGSGDKRKKKKDRNGNKKLKGNSKKSTDLNDSAESINIDVEGEADDILNLRDLMQDLSRGPSPADSVSSSGSTKRRDKSKNKKRKERVSPNSGA